MGHSKCGAVNLAVNSTPLGNITHITKKITKSIEQFKENNNNKAIDEDEKMHKITWLNIHNSVHEILDSSPYTKEQVEIGQVKIVPAYYETQSGKVIFAE